MSYWAALGQVGGVFLNQEASEQRRRQLGDLNAFQQDGRGQADRWAMEDEADLIGDMRGFTDQRYDSQERLASELSSPNRAIAGDIGRARANESLSRALGMVNTDPSGNRAALTGGAGFKNWKGASDARSQPLLDARRNLIMESRGQRGQARYDTQALDRNANTSIDLSRQAQERQRRSQLLAMERQRMLTQLGIEYADPGPTRSQQNLGMAAGLLGAAGGVADSYSANRQSSGYSSELGYDPGLEDRGSRVTGYTYNPYGRP